MELDPDFVKEFACLKISTRDISAEELAKFDANVPLKARAQVKHTSYKHVPQFFYVPPPPDDKLRHLLRREAQSLFLQQKSEELLNNEELQQLWRLLEQHVTETTAKQQLISYDDYCRLRSALDKKCRKYLTTCLFAQLLSESPYLGSVEIASVFNYTMRKVWLTQCRIGLSFYDDVGQGYLREFDLENYIVDLIPTLGQICDCMDPAFEKFYVCTVVKRFYFFLDPLRTGRIRIREMLVSGLIHQLMELRDEPKPTELEPVQLNPFSMPAVLAVYGSFLNLDLDHNGLLNKQELSRYGSGTLTSVFMDRVFEECHTYDGEMDYKTYLGFVLALENRQTSSSLHYLFRMLDVQHTGYLTMQTLNYFFKGIEEQLALRSAEAVRFEDFSNEIFDMVTPKDPCKITLKDLSNCGQAETVVSILIEFHKFWAYENRDDNPQNA
ncbi:PREDICTED: serine/threonine-protein phosphatase 2A regulatory subunit B'' subunit gamma-like isoform X1 [Drosophila arizonae]|uniref:Serine/threonine-protein phosphatase 2A regulatory subunit B'' subunit gamma-like isoform X1 n=1 Tax=Drosophila arizonae TaxID=7263 RepID=A0ABM1Q5Q1_DROAR|nr:PREDICTED: serine/threonine-protein phosphatase 2A regulatory subunit B'' subunit gamma-like isoform X1 [Drosophila arizonae]